MKKQILFVAPPFAGHFNPLLALTLAARDAGYSVRFLTGPRKFPTLARHGIPAVSLPSIGPDTLEQIANTAEPVRSDPLRLIAQFRQNLRLLPGIQAELRAHLDQDPPALIAADSVAPIAGLCAQERSIPWITTIATPFSLETSRGTPTYLGGWSPLPGFPGQIRDALGRGFIRCFKHFIHKMFQTEFRALGLHSLYRANGEEAIYSPQALLGFGLRELEFDRDWPDAFEMIGPVIANPEPPFPLALPDQRPRVLLTHGTHLHWAKPALVNESAALARALPDLAFVLSLGEPERAGEPPLRPAPNLCVYPFVPYASHLHEFDAIVHHGGAGVTYAAILAGLPSLVLPRDYDQFDYAARIECHGLGLRRSRLDPRDIPLLLHRSRWPALSRFQAAARAYQPEARFLATVERLIGPPQSTDSPGQTSASPGAA
jgi:UDP:flavonoid glycosyltransferase YjiC (YdhE family)